MKKLIRNILLIGILATAGLGTFAYFQAFSKNVKKDYVLLVPKGADFQFVVNELESGEVLKSTGSFEWISRVRSYDKLVKPGRYELKAETNNWELVRKLRSGDQDAMKIRFGCHRTLDELAKEISDQMEFSEDTFLALMKDDTFLKDYGVNSKTVRNLFIPNTYFVYWTAGPEDIFQKMKGNFDQFWNEERRQKAERLGMDVHEVVTLASIVQAETYMADERPAVAGLYLNRLRDGMPLQADPTVIFAIGDFTIKRVLKSHLEYDSPYNTYLYAGLPPGPINNPEPSSIDGVLNYQAHNYYYMCAKADFSGYHNFSSTLSQHNRYAKEYQRALNKLKVYK